MKGQYKVLTMLVLGALSCGAHAANWYVRPSGGSGSGTNWNTAWNGFSAIPWSSVACGDTIWVAGGDYTGSLLPAKKCTSGSRLYIRRARSDSTEVTSAAGWSSSFDSTVHQINGAGIKFNGDWDYITISGRTISTGGNHGWWIDLSTKTAGTGIEFANGAGSDYNVLEYMNIQGPGFISYTGDGRGIDATPFSTATGNTFNHIKIWNWESAIYLAGINNTTFEYMEMYGVAAVNASTYHPNGIYTANANGLTIRYSRFHSDTSGRGIGEGIFCEQSGGCANWLIYGNIFYNLSSKVIQITSSVPSVKIFNNTFSNLSWTPIQIRADQGGACATGSETRNNLFYSSSSSDTCGVMSNNIFISSTPNPFINSAANDYHIISNTGGSYSRNTGANLSSYFTTDMDGVTFGGDGTWDVGAYEFKTSSSSQTIQPVQNLR